MRIEGNRIYSNAGLVLVRKEDKLVVGNYRALGYIYDIGGVHLESPRLELPEDYEELTVTQLYSLYPELVEKYIRSHYTVSDELAIHRQRDTKPEQFKEYFDYCEECKARAKRELGL